MKNLFKTILLILWLASAAFATEVTIQNFSLSNWQYGGTSAKLRVVANDSFLTSDNKYIVAGSFSRNAWYKETVCSVVMTTLSCPQVAIDSTTDSDRPESASYTVALYDSKNIKRDVGLFTDYIKVPPVLTVNSWAWLRTYNQTNETRQPTPFYPNRDEILQWISDIPSNPVLTGTFQTLAQRNAANGYAGLGPDGKLAPSLLSDAAVGVRGATQLDTAPISIPVAVGTNSPRLQKNLALDYGNSLASAITAIGSANTLLSFKSDTIVSSVLNVPANIVLSPENGAKIIESGTGTINCAGNCLANPNSKQAVFAGFEPGDIVFSGTDYPSELSTELFDTGNVSLTDRIKIADTALLGKNARIVAYPRTITDTVTITEFHEIFFTAGEYQNNLNTWLTTFTPAFLLKNNTSLTGDGLARINESPIDGNAYFAYAHHMRFGGGESNGINSNITISGLYFVGSDDHNDISGGNALINLGNAHNSSIKFNTFDRVHAYAANIGGFGISGNSAYNSEIIYNRFIGMGSQIANVLNGVNCRVNFNWFDQTRTNNNSTYVVVDLEPNATDEKLKNIEVRGNTFDFTNEIQSQAEHIDVIGTVATSGNLTITVTAAGLTGSPIAVSVPVLAGDTAKQAAKKIRTALAANTNINNFFWVYGESNRFKLAKRTIEAADGTFNIALANGTAAGLTAVPTSFDALKFGAAIAAQAAGIASGSSIFIKDNIILGREVSDIPYFAPLTNGISAYGISELHVTGNYVRGAFNSAYDIKNSRYVKFTDNSGLLNSDGSGNAAALLFRAIADGDVYGNIFNTGFTVQSQATGIFESELEFSATSAGSVVTIINEASNRAYKFWKGLKVIFANNEYTVASVDHTAQTVTMTTSVGTFPAQSPTSISYSGFPYAFGFLSGHNLTTGEAVKLGGVLPTGLNAGQLYYVLASDAGTIRFYPTRADSLANTNVVQFTDNGSTPAQATVYRVLRTKFSSNTFRDNKASNIITEPTGTSIVYSRYTDFTKKETITIDAASVPANSASVQTFPLVGAKVGDTVVLNPPSLTAGLLVMQSRISAPDVLEITFFNSTISAIDQISGVWNYKLDR